MNKTFKVIYNRARKTLMVASERTRSLKKKGTKTVLVTASALLASTAFAASATETVTWSDATPPSESTITVEKSGNDSVNALNITGSASGTLSNASVTLTATDVAAPEKEVQLSAVSWSNTGASSQDSNSVVFGGDKTTFTVSANVTDDTNPVSVYAFNRFGAGSTVSFEATTTELSATSTSDKGQSVSGLSVFNFFDETENTVVNLGGTTVNVKAQTSSEGASSSQTVAAYGIENRAGTIVSKAENLNVTVNSKSTAVASAADAYGISNLGGTITANNQTKIEATSSAGKAAGLEVKALTQELTDGSTVTKVATVNLANANITATSTSSKAGALLLFGDKPSSEDVTATAKLNISGDLEATIKGVAVHGIYSDGYTSTEIGGKATVTTTGKRSARALNLHGGTVTIKGDSELTATAGTSGAVYGILTDLNVKQGKDGEEGSVVNLEGNVTINATTEGESSYATGVSARYYSKVNLGSEGKTVSVTASGYNARALEVGIQNSSINLGKKDAKLTKVSLTASGTESGKERGYAIWANDYGVANIYADTYEQTSSDVGIYAGVGSTVTLDVGSFASTTKNFALYADGYMSDDETVYGTINLVASKTITLNVEDETYAYAIDIGRYGKATVTGDTTISAKATNQGGIYEDASNAAGIFTSDDSELTLNGALSIYAETPDYAVGIDARGEMLSLGSKDKDVSITTKALRSVAINAQSAVTVNMGTASDRLKDVTLKSELVEGDDAASVIVGVWNNAKLNLYAESYSQEGDGQGIQVNTGGSLTMDVDSFTSTTKRKGLSAQSKGSVTINATKFTATQTEAANSLITADDTGTTIGITSDNVTLNHTAAKVTSEKITRISAISVTDGASINLSKKEASTGTQLTANVDLTGNAAAIGICATNASKATVTEDSVTINLNQAKAEGEYTNEASTNARGLYAHTNSSTTEAGSSIEVTGNVAINARSLKWTMGVGVATPDSAKGANTITVNGDTTLNVLTVGTKDETDVNYPAAHGVYTYGNGDTVTLNGSVTIEAEATASDSRAIGVLSQAGGIVNIGSADKTLTIKAKSYKSAALVADEAKIFVGSESAKLSEVNLTSEAINSSKEGWVISADNSSAISIYADAYKQTSSTEGIFVGKDSSLTMNVGSFTSTTEHAAISVNGDANSNVTITTDGEFKATAKSATKEYALITAQNNGSVTLKAKTISLDAWDKKWDVLGTDTGGKITVEAEESLTFNGIVGTDGGTINISGETLNLKADFNSGDNSLYGILTQKSGTTSLAVNNLSIDLSSTYTGTVEDVYGFFASNGTVTIKPKDETASSTLTITQENESAQANYGIYIAKGSTLNVSQDSTKITVNTKTAATDETRKVYGIYVDTSSSTDKTPLVTFTGNLEADVTGPDVATGIILDWTNSTNAATAAALTISGDTTIKATSQASGMARGIALLGATSAALAGAVDITATGGSAYGYGVLLNDGAQIQLGSADKETKITASGGQAYGIYADLAKAGTEKSQVTVAGDTTINVTGEMPSSAETYTTGAYGLYLRNAIGSFGKNLEINATADKSAGWAVGIYATPNSEVNIGTSNADARASITAEAQYATAVFLSQGSKLTFGKKDQECASVALKATPVVQLSGAESMSSVIYVGSGSTLDVYTKQYSQEGTFRGIYLSDDSSETLLNINASESFNSKTGESAITAIGSMTKATVTTGSFEAESASTTTDRGLLETRLGAAIEVDATSINLKAGNKNALQVFNNWGSFSLKASDSFALNGNINAVFNDYPLDIKSATFYLKGANSLTINGDVNVSRSEKYEKSSAVETNLSISSANATMAGNINVSGNNDGKTTLTINATETGTNFTHSGAIAVKDGATLILQGGTYQSTSFVLSKSTLNIADGTNVSTTIELKDNSNFASSLSKGFTGVTVDEETGAVTYEDTVSGKWTVKGDETSTLTVDDTFTLTTEGLSKLGAAYSDVTLNFANATMSLTEDLTVNSKTAFGEFSTDYTITVNEEKSFGITGEGKTSTLKHVVLNASDLATGGTFRTTNKSTVAVTKLEGNKNAKLDVAGESNLHIAELSGTGTTITVGEVDGQGATLTIDKLTMTGGYIFVDPSIGHSTFTVSEYGTDGLNNRVTAANGSLVVFGATESVATNAISQIDGLDSVEALVYVASPLALGESGSLLINSDATDSTTEYADATKVQITKGALVFNQNDIGSSAVFTDASTVTVESDATIAVLNAKVGSSIALTSEENTVTVNGTPTILTDSPFAKGSVDSTSKSVVIEGTADATGLSVIASMGVQSMIRHADAVLAETLADRAATNSTANNGSNLWVAVRGDRYEQDHLGATGGFSADMGYGAFGVDVAPDATKNFGAAFQYGRGTVKGDIYSVKNKTRDYSFALYGSANLGDSGVKLLGDVMFTKSTNKITNTYYTGLNQGLDAYMLSVGVTAQTSFEMSNFTLTPSVGIRASRLKTDAMKLGLNRLDSQHQNFVQVPLSLRLTGKTASTENGWEVTPRFKVSFIPTFGDKSISVYGAKEAVLDTRPLQGAFGVKFAKGAATFDAGAHFGVGNRGTSAIGAKVDFTYRF